MRWSRFVNLGTAAGVAAPLLALASFLVLEGDTPRELLPFLVIFVAPFELGFVFGRVTPWRGVRLGGVIFAGGLALGMLLPMAGPGLFLIAGLAVAFAMPDLLAAETGRVP